MAIRRISLWLIAYAARGGEQRTYPACMAIRHALSQSQLLQSISIFDLSSITPTRLIRLMAFWWCCCHSSNINTKRRQCPLNRPESMVPRNVAISNTVLSMDEYSFKKWLNSLIYGGHTILLSLYKFPRLFSFPCH